MGRDVGIYLSHLAMRKNIQSIQQLTFARKTNLVSASPIHATRRHTESTYSARLLEQEGGRVQGITTASGVGLQQTTQKSRRPTSAPLPNNSPTLGSVQQTEQGSTSFEPGSFQQ